MKVGIICPPTLKELDEIMFSIHCNYVPDYIPFYYFGNIAGIRSGQRKFYAKLSFFWARGSSPSHINFFESVGTFFAGFRPSFLRTRKFCTCDPVIKPKVLVDETANN